eukprot:scaffold26911_cov67-Phaeocystis_antarctica.AAC.2
MGPGRTAREVKVAGEDEQSTARWYNWIAVFFVSVALVLISGNAGLIVERVTNCLIEAVSTQTQKHEHAVTLTSRPFAGNPSLLYQPVLGPSVPANPRPAWANSSSARLRLPRFVSKITDRRWMKYLESVYGDKVSLHLGEVLDLNSFDLFYTRRLQAAGINPAHYEFDTNECPWSHRRYQPQDTIRRNLLSSGTDMRFDTIAPFSWIEVTHCVFNPREIDLWTYMSHGSGIWLNVGNIKTVNTRSPSHPILGRLSKQWAAVINNSNSHTMPPDSVQFLEAEIVCAASEVVFARRGPGRAGLCGAGMYPFKRGFRHQHPFYCHEPHRDEVAAKRKNDTRRDWALFSDCIEPIKRHAKPRQRKEKGK